MSEYKQVLYDMRTTYDGPFVIEDFYTEIDKWIRHKGHTYEPKKKYEHVTKKGKKIEWYIEIHSHLDERSHGSTILRVLIDGMKEIVINKKGKKSRVNTGSVMVEINAFIEGHEHGSFFSVKPVYYFIRTLIDRFIWNYWSDKHVGRVNGDGHELFKIIQEFFDKERKKYG